jgi:nicotinate phosphoribosyltransferase
MAGDTIGRFDEELPGVPLLRPAMLAGQMKALPDLEESRRQVRRELAQLPKELLSPEAAAHPYPVTFSKRLQDDLEALREQVTPFLPVPAR